MFHNRWLKQLRYQQRDLSYLYALLSKIEENIPLTYIGLSLSTA